MQDARINNRMLNLVLAALLFSMAVLSGEEQASKKPASKFDLMIQVVLSAKTEYALRRANAEFLFQDPKAHPALISILEQDNDNNLTAKVIICQVIATSDRSILQFKDPAHIPAYFVKPLFKSLLSENEELSHWAARALVRCDNGVHEKLAVLVSNPSETIAHRLAGIAALELIPGKNSVLVMAGLLDDEQAPIRERARQALAKMLYLTAPLDKSRFIQSILPRLKQLDDKAFLLWQIERQRETIRHDEDMLKMNQARIAELQKKYFDSLGEKLNHFSDAKEKLAFLRNCLVKQPDEALRIWAMQKISEWSKTSTVSSGPITPTLVQLLSGFIGDASVKVRQYTAVALGRLEFELVSPLAGDLLTQLSQETDPDVQAELLATLGKLEYLPTIKQALELLDKKDISPRAAQEAVRAIGRICAARAKDIPAKTIEEICQRLVANYRKWNGSAELLSAAIQAMQRIAEQEKFQVIAKKHFRVILTNALQNKEAIVRSAAVYALSVLLKQQVLPLILDSSDNMLEDDALAVRFAVIAAIENYGGSEQLSLLYHRLDRETDADAMTRIETAFMGILSSLSLDSIQTWAINLQSSSPAQQQMRSKVLQLMQTRIAAAKADGTAVDVKYEVFLYQELAAVAVRKDLPDQALANCRKLLELSLPAADKYPVQMRVLDLALQSGYSDLLQLAAPVVKSRANDRPEILQKIAGVIDSLDLSDNKQLIRAAVAITALVVPLEKYPSPALKQQWQGRIDRVALALVNQQDKQVAQTGKADLKTIGILKRLNPLLNSFPADGTARQQRQALKEYRRILQKEVSIPNAADNEHAAQTDKKEVKKPQQN